MFQTLRMRLLASCLIAVVLAIGAVLIHASRSSDAMLFYYGAAPEVPGGQAIPIMNPFRNRVAEQTAEQLISDLETPLCDSAVRNLHSETERVCPVLQKTKRHRLIWRKDEQRSRLLVYDLPESQSRLQITFGIFESGFEIKSVSLIM